MNKYTAKFSGGFKKNLKEIKRDFELTRRLNEKIKEIVKEPYHYKPLRNVLKNRRRTHIGSFVLIFEVREEEKFVVFHSFQHHDEAYRL